MNHHYPLTTLKFSWLEYPVSDIDRWMSQIGLDCFVFNFFFPATADPERPIHLCCFAHKIVGGQSSFLNPDNPDILTPYRYNALLLNGPVRMAANLVSVASMNILLPGGNSKKDHLLFVPALNNQNQVYYTITGFQRTDHGDIFDDQSIDTNPSPPATSL